MGDVSRRAGTDKSKHFWFSWRATLNIRRMCMCSIFLQIFPVACNHPTTRAENTTYSSLLSQSPHQFNNIIMEPADELASSLSGEHIAKMLRTDGPIVSCVLLRASTSSHDANDDTNDDTNDDKKPSSEAKESDDATPREVLADLISEIKIDTTPKKQMVAQTLGGPFTFLGQYEEEGTVLMIRRPEDVEDSDLALNLHTLQPPLHDMKVRGDILLMRVAAVEDEEQQNQDDANETSSNADANSKPSDSEESEEANTGKGKSAAGAVMPNEEFFLNYTKEEYITFALRTDIVATEPAEGDDAEESVEGSEEDDDEDDDDDEDEEEDGEYDIESDEEDMDDEECQIGMMNMILAQILKRFREENGRGPNTEELLAMRSALAEKLGIDESLVNEKAITEGASTTSDKRKLEDSEDSPGQGKRVKFNNEDQVKIMTDDESNEADEIVQEEGKSAVAAE